MKETKENKKYRIQFKSMQAPMLVLLLLGIAILFSNTNITYEKQNRKVEVLDKDTFSWKSREDREKEALTQGYADYLYLWDSSDAQSALKYEDMKETLLQIDADGKKTDVAQEEIPQFSDYSRVLVGVSKLEMLGERIFDLMNWVEEGGNLMFVYPPEGDAYFSLIKNKLGILEGAQKMYMTQGFRFKKAFMIGGNQDMNIIDAYESSLEVILDEKCKVYLVSNDEKENPLLWERSYGEGKIVFWNSTYTGKAYRGFEAAAYSLMDTAFAWPVINASTFYIDDFPSPVPSGTSQYIERDYQMTIDSFYTQIWWRDVKNIAEKYHIRYTGLTIENYSDNVEPPFDTNEDIRRFRYFGNSLLDMGGEIGYHGYNHMPLVLSDFPYPEEYNSYRKWKSVDAMKQSLLELKSFNEKLFPEEKFQVYVPPSNILSEEGRETLKECLPDLKAIASIYFADETAYSQEFEVSPDGIVETPRIVSGYMLDDFQKLAVVSELNLHFVNSHFQHPDDVMDEDRGAELGWEKLFEEFSRYVEWLHYSVPDIRSLTGSEMAAAVQRYYYTKIQQEISDDTITLFLENFQDEAWLLLRINIGIPGETKGAELTEVADGLYLVQARKSKIEISLEQEEDGA